MRPRLNVSRFPPHIGSVLQKTVIYYGATIICHHPLKRADKEHFRDLHGSDDQFEESFHTVTVVEEVVVVEVGG